MPSVASSTCEGAGKIHGRQPMTLNAASQVSSIVAQIAIFLSPLIFIIHLRVDAVAIVFDLAAHLPHPRSNSTSVESARVPDLDLDLSKDARRGRMQHDVP